MDTGSEKGAPSVSFTSNALTIKQATDSHCLFCLSRNCVFNTEEIRKKGGKDPLVFLPLQCWKPS